jgi:hypothetical protein
MQEHECTKNIATPYDKFYFDEEYYFPIFHEHKNTKLNHFHLFQKGANFRVLKKTSTSIEMSNHFPALFISHIHVIPKENKKLVET